MTMHFLKTCLLLTFSLSLAQGSATREGLLEDAIEGGAPTVLKVLHDAGLATHVPLHQALAREALIMVYLDEDHDPSLSDFDHLFAMAGLPNSDDNLDIVIKLINAMPDEDASESEDYDGEGSGDEVDGDQAAGAA